jgi:hypothetical protein
VLYRYSRCGRRLFSGVSNNFQRTVSSFNHMRLLMALNCLKESRLYVFRSIVETTYSLWLITWNLRGDESGQRGGKRKPVVWGQYLWVYSESMKNPKPNYICW